MPSDGKAAERAEESEDLPEQGYKTLVVQGRIPDPVDKKGSSPDRKAVRGFFSPDADSFSTAKGE
ncbi:hypothetical protein TRIP_B360025 [uncultured Desulfatiglans sp.]|nr:hypothetical protein TRIP_B360025 [uncultured Desulfatiglans sp.]